MKITFNKKIIIIGTGILISLILFIILIKSVPKYTQYLKEVKKSKEQELILHERKTDELKLKGEFNQALEGYRILAEKTKDPSKKVEAEFMQANIYAHQLKDNTKAQNMYIDIIKNRGNYKDNPKRVVDGLMEMGLMYWNEKNYKESAKMYKIAIEEYPDKIDYSQVAWNLGACYQMLGKNKEALEMIAESQKRR